MVRVLKEQPQDWLTTCFSWERPAAAAAAKSLQSCPTLRDPIDGSPPGSPIPGILQTRTLESVAISFSSTGKCKGKVKSLSRVWLLVTSWTAAYQAPLSMGSSRQEDWSGVPLPSPEKDLLGGRCIIFYKMRKIARRKKKRVFCCKNMMCLFIYSSHFLRSLSKGI